jgi:hypothetical protein
MKFRKYFRACDQSEGPRAYVREARSAWIGGIGWGLQKHHGVKNSLPAHGC